MAASPFRPIWDDDHTAMHIRPDGDKSADLAWVVGTRFQSRGYATEPGRRVAAWIRECLKVTEVRAAIHPEHAASCRVAAHIGLRPSSELTDEGERIWTTRQG